MAIWSYIIVKPYLSSGTLSDVLILSQSVAL